MKYLRLLRVHQWIKNLFIFIPAFFGGVIVDINNILLLLAGFGCFSIVASGIYILNDYRDVESDKKHPTKKHRPIASGSISKTGALIIMVFIVPVGLITSYLLDPMFFTCLLFYFLLNIGYSLGLKHISILDILIVALGFLLRTVSGGYIIDIAVSSWLVIMIFLLALFLAFAKRRDDLVIHESSGVTLRKASKHYNIEFINNALSMISAVIVVAYIMYTLSPEVMEHFHTGYVYYTGIFVVAGILRYLQLSLVENDTGSPTKIFYSDRFIQATLAGWLISFYFIIYYT